MLIVTSDFHTRRALEVFRREFPGHEYSVAAARNEEGFGADGGRIGNGRRHLSMNGCD